MYVEQRVMFVLLFVEIKAFKLRDSRACLSLCEIDDISESRYLDFTTLHRMLETYPTRPS